MGKRVNKVSGYLRSGAAKQKLLQNPPLYWGEKPSEKQFRRHFRFSFATPLRYAGSLKTQISHRKMRHHVFGEILNGFQRAASSGFQVHDDVRHAVGLPLLPKLDDAFGAAAQVDVVVELGGGVRVFQEFDEIRHAKGFPRFAVAQFFEHVDDVAQFFGGDTVPNPRVGLVGNPVQTLFGFGHQVQIAAESAVVFAIERGEFFLRQAADDLPRFAVAFGAVVEIGGKGGVFGGAVAAGKPQQETPAADLVNRCGFFGGEHGFTQRRHIARRAEHDVLGQCGEITQRYRRVVNLPDIAKTLVVKRHIAHP